jgi:hypothetical protein
LLSRRHTSHLLISHIVSSLYQTLSPFADALLRIAVGLALVPHGLGNTFGFSPNTGVRALNLAALAKQLDESGYRPGNFWAPAISITQLVGGVYSPGQSPRWFSFFSSSPISSAGASAGIFGINSAWNIR